MRNLLRTNYLTAFTTSDKGSENASGGIALWDTPQLIQNAYNPLMFTRTKYLHKTGGYEPEGMKPNYIRISSDGKTLIFDYVLASGVRVSITDSASVEHQYTIGEGRTSWTPTDLAGATIASVKSVALSTDDYDADFASDTSYIYVRIGYAYRDQNYMCSADGQVLYKNSEVESTELKIYKTDGSYQKLTAESFNGITKFDVSAVVRTWLAPELADFPAEANVMSEKALSVRYIVRQINGTASYTYLAVNGVAQVGENPDRSADVSRILTKFSKLDLYEGYDLDYSIISGNTTLHSARGALQTLAISRIRVDNAAIKLLDEVGNCIQDEQGNDIEILPALDIPVFGHCKPSNPFYVRWINQLGGVDYYMFARQQKHQPQVKSVSVYAPFVENPLYARTNRKAYAMDTENVVTVGAELLNETDFNALRWLAFARKIEYYDETLGKWISLSVSKFDGSFNTKADTHTVEVTFSLPKINTQF